MWVCVCGGGATESLDTFNNWDKGGLTASRGAPAGLCTHTRGPSSPIGSRLFAWNQSGLCLAAVELIVFVDQSVVPR